MFHTLFIHVIKTILYSNFTNNFIFMYVMYIYYNCSMKVLRYSLFRNTILFNLLWNDPYSTVLFSVLITLYMLYAVKLNVRSHWYIHLCERQQTFWTSCAARNGWNTRPPLYSRDKWVLKYKLFSSFNSINMFNLLEHWAYMWTLKRSSCQHITLHTRTIVSYETNGHIVKNL